MEIDNNQSLKPLIAAAMAAAVIVFISDLAYRTMVVRASSSLTRAPIDPAVLERFPFQIGNWTGRDIPMDEAVARATGTDARINRQYQRDSGLESIGLYVATGGAARALVAHRPEVCYLASGWTLDDRHSVVLRLVDGKTLPCTIFQFSRGGLNNSEKTVLHYYIVDGEYCGDVSQLRRKVWRGSDSIGYAVQVQIATDDVGIQASDWGTDLVSAFAVESAEPIAQLFTHHQANAEQSVARSSSREGK